MVFHTIDQGLDRGSSIQSGGHFQSSIENHMDSNPYGWSFAPASSSILRIDWIGPIQFMDRVYGIHKLDRPNPVKDLVLDGLHIGYGYDDGIHIQYEGPPHLWNALEPMREGVLR